MAKFKTYLSQFIILLVALQVLNLGFYAQDFTISRFHNGTETNIINSVTEYVAEVMMKKKNAFPEKREKSNQSEHQSIYKFQPFKIYSFTKSPLLQLAIMKSHNYNKFVVDSYINHNSDITIPPPKNHFTV